MLPPSQSMVSGRIVVNLGLRKVEGYWGATACQSKLGFVWDGPNPVKS